MKRKLTKSELIKTINTLKFGDRIYINSINCTPKAVDTIRTLIITNVITPDQSITATYYNDVTSVLSGSVILPQNEYIKL